MAIFLRMRGWVCEQVIVLVTEQCNATQVVGGVRGSGLVGRPDSLPQASTHAVRLCKAVLDTWTSTQRGPFFILFF